MFIINTNTHLSSSDGNILRMLFIYKMKESSTIAFSVKRERLFVESFEPTYKQLCVLCLVAKFEPNPVCQVYILKVQVGNKVALSQLSPQFTSICRVIVSHDACQ